MSPARPNFKKFGDCPVTRLSRQKGHRKRSRPEYSQPLGTKTCQDPEGPTPAPISARSGWPSGPGPLELVGSRSESEVLGTFDGCVEMPIDFLFEINAKMMVRLADCPLLCSLRHTYTVNTTVDTQFGIYTYIHLRSLPSTPKPRRPKTNTTPHLPPFLTASHQHQA